MKNPEPAKVAPPDPVSLAMPMVEEFAKNWIWNSDDRADFTQSAFMELKEKSVLGQIKLTTKGTIPVFFVRQLLQWRWLDYLRSLRKRPRSILPAVIDSRSTPDQEAERNEFEGLGEAWVQAMLAESSAYRDPIYYVLLLFAYGLDGSARKTYRREDLRQEYGQKTGQAVDPRGTAEDHWQYFKRFEAMLHRIKAYLQRKPRPKWSRG